MRVCTGNHSHTVVHRREEESCLNGFQSRISGNKKMHAAPYEEVALSDMLLEDGKLRYPCPCGDLFELSLSEFAKGSVVAECPTCSLTVRIICNEEERHAFLLRCNALNGVRDVVIA